MGSLSAVWCLTLMGGTVIIAAKECTKDNYEVKINGHSICCPPCIQSDNSQVCPDADHRRDECRCSRGYGCYSKSCTMCQPVPNCTKGSQLKRSEQENTVFQYDCEKCPKGTHSDQENGICKPGVDTESSTYGIYSSVPSTQKPDSELDNPNVISASSLNNWTSLALFLALAAFIILLITVAIHLLIWKMKAAKLLKNAGMERKMQILGAVNIQKKNMEKNMELTQQRSKMSSEITRHKHSSQLNDLVLKN